MVCSNLSQEEKGQVRSSWQIPEGHVSSGGCNQQAQGQRVAWSQVDKENLDGVRTSWVRERSS